MRRAAERRDWMSRQGGVRVGWLCGVLMLAALIAPSAAAASTYRWQVDANGDWNNPANWALVEGPAGAGYPNLAGDAAVFDVAPTSLRFITIPTGVTITVGRIAFDYGGDNPLVINRTGTGSFVFDNLGEDAVIESTGHGSRDISVPVQLNADLVVNGVTGSGVLMKSISESGGARNVTVNAGGLILTETNTYSGTTTVTAGALTVTDGVTIRIPGALIVGGGPGPAIAAVASISGDSVNPLAPVTIHADGHAFFSRAFGQPNQVRIGDLSIFDGMVTLGTSGTVLTTSSLTMEGGRLLGGASAVVLIVNGAVTATSTATETALIEGIGFGSALLNLPSATNDFIVANGPQPIDLSIDIPINGINGGESLRKLGEGVARLNGNNTYTGATTIVAGTLLMNGTQGGGAVSVDTQGTLGGFGTLGPITAAPDSTVLVGGSTAGSSLPTSDHSILRSGSVVLGNSTHVRFGISGGTAGSGYDQLRVTGTVNLGNAVPTVTSRLVLPPDGTFTIIDNDGNDPVIGTFLNTPEGATIGTESGAIFRLSYQGGDGNDVVLTNLTPVTYFLSEGATGSFFDEDVLIANPHTVAAPITLTFFLPGGGTIVQQRTVPAQSRLTIHVDEITGLEETSPSLEVKSDNRLTLAVDRTMFWDHTHYGGHTANAVPQLEQEWLFAEGVQNDFFQTFLLLGNPNPVIVTATITFLREGEPPFVKTLDLPANSRVTVSAADIPELVGRSFGMTVRTGTQLAISAERATYFASTPARLWSGGHANVGSAEASTSWFHPEGASGSFFSTFILVSNPQDTPANVTYRFLLTNGDTVQTTRTILAKQRITVNPVDTGDLRLANAAFSTIVTSDVPVVSERAMYWPGDDTPFGEGHASSGLTTTALDWVLAEGRVGGPSAYTTYILLANPQSTAANVTVTFLRETGEPIVKTVTVAPTSRFNVDVGVTVPELQNTSFGARIQVTNNVPIAVERSMYWDADGRFWAGGSNALASMIPR